MKHLEMTCALKNGVITSISDVSSGLSCECICPACGAILVARKGTQRMHHFAHYKKKDCEYAYETSLHWAAKDILSRSGKMIIPAVYINFPQSYKNKELIKPEIEIAIEQVALEKRFGDVVPDVVVYTGGKFFFIEIFVTHPICQEKLEKLKEQNISTIEIDLSNMERNISNEELSDILLKSDSKKTWKYNAVSDQWYQKFVDASDKMPIKVRGFAVHVDGCPIETRRWRGKPYANVIDDCTDCEYFICGAEKYILCSGRNGFSRRADFSISEEKRTLRRNTRIAERDMKLLANYRCLDCGRRLIQEKRNSGMFWVCSNPRCRFILYVDPETGELLRET